MSQVWPRYIKDKDYYFSSCVSRQIFLIFFTYALRSKFWAKKKSIFRWAYILPQDTPSSAVLREKTFPLFFLLHRFILP